VLLYALNFRLRLDFSWDEGLDMLCCALVTIMPIAMWQHDS
jgi:hypothetical protein